MLKKCKTGATYNIMRQGDKEIRSDGQTVKGRVDEEEEL